MDQNGIRTRIELEYDQDMTRLERNQNQGPEQDCRMEHERNTNGTYMDQNNLIN